MQSDRLKNEIAIANLPRLIVLSTAVLLATGLAAGLAWWQTGNPVWIRLFFSYPGALFFAATSAVQLWLSVRCARLFSVGDLLRPAWVLIAVSALARLAGDLTRLLGAASALNPLLLLPGDLTHAVMGKAVEYGPLFNPLYMFFLALGLLYVLKACRQNGIAGRITAADVLLIGLVVAYTINFFATGVLAPAQGAAGGGVQKILSWTSDPLLCVLLFQAILIRRSVSSMGWGLIARCWLSFTVAIFATSMGDIGLWAWSKGYLPHALEAASWFVWFLASAAYALGPAYQLQAMLHATVPDNASGVLEELEIA